MRGVQPYVKTTIQREQEETGKLQILNEPLHLFYLVLQIVSYVQMDSGPKSSNVSCLTMDTEMLFTNSQQACKPLFSLFPFPFSLSWRNVSEKTPQEFFPIIFPVSQDHQEDHQQNHLLYQKAEMPGSTRAAEGPTDKTGEPAAKEAEVPTERAFKEPTTEARLH